MPSPKKEEILTYNYSLDGSPWVRVGTTADVNISTFQYSFDGAPWFGVETPKGPLEMNLSTFKIYNKVLTDQEVLQNYNAQKSRFGL